MKNYYLLKVLAALFLMRVPVNAQLTEPNGPNGGPVSAVAVIRNEIFAGTAGGGIWRRHLSDIVTVKDFTNNSPAAYKLEQNYPNPFNPSTTISYTLEESSEVSLIIYNNLGQQVLVLISGFQQAGSHIVKFNAYGLSSGIYYYRIISGAFVQTKKLMLLR